MNMLVYQAPQPKALLSRRAFFDTFTDDNATVITSHTPTRPTGCNWVASGAPNFTIESNKLNLHTPGLEYCSPNGWLSPNFFLRAQVNNGQHQATSTAHYLMFGFRLDVLWPVNGWMFQWGTLTQAAGENHIIRIRKFVSGTPTELDYLILEGMDYNHTGICRLVVSGNSFKFSIDHNPAWTLTYTDPDYFNASAGKISVVGASYNVVPTSPILFDNLFLLRL